MVVQFTFHLETSNRGLTSLHGGKAARLGNPGKDHPALRHCGKRGAGDSGPAHLRRYQPGHRKRISADVCFASQYLVCISLQTTTCGIQSSCEGTLPENRPVPGSPVCICLSKRTGLFINLSFNTAGLNAI